MRNQTALNSAQARKIILLSQGVYSEKDLGAGADAALKAIQQLGYIQIDTISVVERAHHHTLWNRVAEYKNSYLDQLQAQGMVFEYWSHAAAYLPMRDFRYSLPRKLGVQRRDHGYWDFQDKKLIKQVKDRIRIEGPLQARDFTHKAGVKTKGWPEKKPAKKALDQLFMEGELMIARRDGFQKVYDLTERVLPSNVDSSFPSDIEYHQHLIFNFLAANGLGSPAQMSYLLKGLKPVLQKVCDQLLEEDQLILLTVNRQDYYALPSIEQLLSKPLGRKRLKILSPFDNLLIQRQRSRALFDFDYQMECYLPAAKRKYGYFCLPLLWGNQFVGRMDAKIDRKTGILHIQSLSVDTQSEADFKHAFQLALNEFLAFNQGQFVEYLKP